MLFRSLDELDNDFTKVTPASFEPTIDYVVTKMPRFTFEKFPGADPMLTTSMKSVGEAMAIGRNFAESLQKALRSMETGLTGLNEVEIPEAIDAEGKIDRDAIRTALAAPRPDRLLTIAQAFRYGLTLVEILETTHFDPWFLRQVQDLVTEAEGLAGRGEREGEFLVSDREEEGAQDRRRDRQVEREQAAPADLGLDDESAAVPLDAPFDGRESDPATSGQVGAAAGGDAGLKEESGIGQMLGVDPGHLAGLGPQSSRIDSAAVVVHCDADLAGCDLRPNADRANLRFAA